MPTNWKREGSEGCSAAAPLAAAAPAQPGLLRQDPLRLPGAPRPGPGAHGPLALSFRPNQGLAHRHAGSRREGGDQGHQQRDRPAGVPLGKGGSAAGERRGWKDF